MRLDKALFERGLASSRTNARALIAQGRVSVNGEKEQKPGKEIAEDALLDVAADTMPDFVSRAGRKLYGALEALPELRVHAKRCLDAGASTGGFTEVLLRAGAKRVIAVDVGHGQMAPLVREDPRVEVHEGMNVRYMSPEEIGGPCELTVADLSFISLTLVLPALIAATSAGGDLLLMIKPQFEVGRANLSAQGVVRSPTLREEAVRRILDAGEEAGLSLFSVQPSGLPGQDGNKEYFVHFGVSHPLSDEVQSRKIERETAITALRNAGHFM